MKNKSQYTCMYLVPPEIYTRLLENINAREKIKVQELNTSEVGNENGAFPAVPGTPDHDDNNTSQDDNGNDDDDDDDDYDGNNGDGYGGEYNPPPNRSSSSSSNQSRHSSSTDTASETERFLQDNPNYQLNNSRNRAFQLIGDSDDDDVFSNNFARQPQSLQPSLDSANFSQQNPTTSKNVGKEIERIMNEMIKIKNTALEQQKVLQNINKKTKQRIINSSNTQTQTQTPIRAVEYHPQPTISQANISVRPLQNRDLTRAIEYRPQSVINQANIANNPLQEVNSIRAIEYIPEQTTVQAVLPNIQTANPVLTNPQNKNVIQTQNQDSKVSQSSSGVRRKSYICNICSISFSTARILNQHKKDFHFPETKEAVNGNYLIWKNVKSLSKSKKNTPPKSTRRKKKKNATIISLQKSDISMSDGSNKNKSDVLIPDFIRMPNINDIPVDSSIITPDINDIRMDSISVLQCKLCPATFNTQNALYRHLRNIHEADVNYNSKNIRGVKRKIENTAGNITEKTSGKKKRATHFYKCKLCDSRFKDEKTHDRHVKNIHNANANYKSNLPQGEKRKRPNSKNINLRKWVKSSF